MTSCPDCLAANPPGTLFCVACMRPLGGTPAPAGGPGLPGSPRLVPSAAAAVAQPPRAAGVAHACAPVLRLVAVENLQDTGLVLALPDLGYTGTLLVGRSDLAGGTVVDLDLTSAGGHARRVSRRHARLRYESGRVYVSDWESAHGTWLDKQRLGPGEERPLADGDELRLADFVFRVALG